MADEKDGWKDPKRPLFPKEPASQDRLLPASLVIMVLVLLAVPYLSKYFLPQPPPAPTQPSPAKPAAAAPLEPAPRPAGRPARPAPPVSAAKEETFIIETDLYRVALSNRGAVVRSWVLKKYKDTAGKPLELVNVTAAAKVGYPFAIEFKDTRPSAEPNQALFAAKPSPDRLGIDYEYSDGTLVIRKSYQFQKDAYRSQVSSQVTQAGAGLPHLLAWRGGFGDFAVPNPAASQRSLYFDVPAGKLITKDAKAARKGPVTDYGTYSFAGLQDNYFAAVLLPPTNTQLEVRTLSDTTPNAVNAKEEPHVGVAVGGASRNEFRLFAGPKDLELLRKVDARLEYMVDWGWFWFLAKPLFLILNWVNGFLHSYGWSIMAVTVLINFCLLPLRLKSMGSMKKMQSIQPEIAALQAKYKGLGLRDPKKAQQNQEMMELYRKHGINPVGGCLPMLVQIPFFIAFYKVLMVAIEMRGANWLWVTDLSQPEHLAIRILPVAMVISQFVMQKMTPTTTADPTQQRMMLFMPLIFGFMFYQFQSGLVLYWLTSNLVGIAQQWFINKTSLPALTPAPQPVPVKAKGKFKKGGKGKR